MSEVNRKAFSDPNRGPYYALQVGAETLQTRVRQALEANAAAKREPANTTQLARAIGIAQPSLKEFLDGAAVRHKHILDIAKVLDVNPWWLQDGEGPMILDSEEAVTVGALGRRMLDYNGVRFVPVPVLDIAAGAGMGRVVDHERHRFDVLFRNDWLRRVTTASPNKLAMIEISGQSMEPTLRNGDQVLVDRSADIGRLDDSMYVILFDDQLWVKRLQEDRRRRMITMTSDNPSVKPRTVARNEVQVQGRVIWVGRQVYTPGRAAAD